MAEQGLVEIKTDKDVEQERKLAKDVMSLAKEMGLSFLSNTPVSQNQKDK